MEWSKCQHNWNELEVFFLSRSYDTLFEGFHREVSRPLTSQFFNIKKSLLFLKEFYYSANIICQKNPLLREEKDRTKKEKKKYAEDSSFLEYIVNAHYFHLFAEYSQIWHDWTVECSFSKRQALRPCKNQKHSLKLDHSAKAFHKCCLWQERTAFHDPGDLCYCFVFGTSTIHAEHSDVWLYFIVSIWPTQTFGE